MTARISALRMAAPAAPRMVLWESRVNFQSKRVQGRRRPTVRCHPLSTHEVEAGLRASVFGGVLDGEDWGGGEVEAIETFAVEGLEFCPGGEDFGVGGGGAEFDADALGMAVDDGDAVAVRGEGEGGGIEAGGGGGAEELGYFFLELLFFVLDVGDDVAEDVERSYSGVAGSGDGLHGGDEELVDAKAGFERCEGKH